MFIVPQELFSIIRQLNCLYSSSICSSFTVSVVQIFTDQIRSVSETLETNTALMSGLREDLRDCKDVVREAVSEFLLHHASTNRTTGSTEPEVDPDEDWMGGWPQMIVVWVLLSCWLQLGLIAHRLEVPRTTVS